MKKDTLYSIGEALIDFIPDKKGCEFDEVTGFSPALGGAPANVCGAFSKLGGKSEMITQLGNDPFGHKILKELKANGIGTEHITLSDKANTCLAFVSLAKDGNRTFSFYRNPSADMLYESENLNKSWFENAFALHFCSVSLVDSPMKLAHEKAIEYAKANNALISFDPNLRFALWKDKEKLRNVIWDFIPKCDIIKISDEEVKFICGTDDTEKATQLLFDKGVKLILFTCGKDGAYAYTKKVRAFAKSKKVSAVDTTGAGDAFSGSFLYSLYKDGINTYSIEALDKTTLEKYLEFSNNYCGMSVTKKGAIPSYPTLNEIDF